MENTKITIDIEITPRQYDLVSHDTKLAEKLKRAAEHKLYQLVQDELYKKDSGLED